MLPKWSRKARDVCINNIKKQAIQVVEEEVWIYAETPLEVETIEGIQPVVANIE